MKSKLLITLLLSFSLLVAACGPADETDMTPTDDMSTLEVPVTGATETTMSRASATAEITETPATSATKDTSNTQVSTVGTATAVTITINDDDGTSEFLVDDQGRALYAYLLDTPDDNMSVCTSDCAVDWPPVLVTGMPTAGDGVDSALLGTITRDDGQMQATYNNWPLYYSDEDLNPGDMEGQGMDEEWFLVSPTGETIQ